MLQDLLCAATCYNRLIMALTNYDALSDLDVAQETWEVWRRRALVFMAGERADLLWLLLGLDELTLADRPIFDAYIARDLLAHIAAWDDLYAERIELVLAGKSGDIASVDLHERNAMLKARHAEWSLKEALEAIEEGRRRFLEALSRVPDQQLHTPVEIPWADSYPMRQWVIWRARHEAGHAEDVRAWRRELALPPMAGPKDLLLAALRASRLEMEALVALIPKSGRATRLVSEAWTLKDVLGHVADWETYCISCIEAGRPLPQQYEGDGQRWNETHAAARRDQPWQQVWNDYHVIRQELLALLGAMSQDEIEAPIDNPWGAHGSPYGWGHAYLAHEREHAATLRESLLIASNA